MFFIIFCFFFALITHFLMCRFIPYLKSSRVILSIFVMVFIIAVVVRSIFFETSLVNAFFFFYCYLSFAFVYIIFFSAVESQSPTLKLFFNYKGKVSKEFFHCDLESNLFEYDEVDDRIAKLVSSGWVTLNSDNFFLSTEGRLFFKFFSFCSNFFKLGQVS